MIFNNILDLSPEPTPILKNIPSLLVKAEALGVTGSHKSRAARYALRQALRDGHICPGGHRRILEKTGGNFGLGLAYYACQIDIGVDLVIGNSFSPIKKEICAEYGAKVIAQDALNSGISPKNIVESLTNKQPDTYYYMDQFHNQSNLDAHMEETGPEFVRQLRALGLSKSAQIFFVGGAGTGASMTGVASALREAFPLTRCFLAHPDSCDPRNARYADHPIEGVAVGVEPPFLDYALIADMIAVPSDCARKGQRLSARGIGLYCGLSSGMNIWAASKMFRDYPFATIVTIAYDTGDAYIRNRDFMTGT